MIEQITLTNFRNHISGRISTHLKNNVIITGPNGAGKTAILEAVSMLGGDKGLRNAPMTDITKFDGDGSFSVFATTDDDTDISVNFTLNDSNRHAKINGSVANMADLADLLRIVWLTPKEDRIFLETATERRTFFDRLIANFDSAHFGRISKFTKLLSERAFALKTKTNNLWLDALDSQLASLAIAITVSRIQYAGQINYFLKEGALSVSGILESMILDKYSATQVEQYYMNYLQENRGLTNDKMVIDGPHKSDFDMFNNILKLPVKITSTGQQKLLLIDLILAHAQLIHAKTNKRPIILLDEIIAHLDFQTQQYIFNQLSLTNSQVWATGIDTDKFMDIPNTAFVTCINGEINNIIYTE